MFRSLYTINALNPPAVVECSCPPQMLMVPVPSEILWAGAFGRRVGQEVGVTTENYRMMSRVLSL